jgi:hypothetical protein
MDLPTFIVEMSKAWAWPLTIFVLGFAAVSKWLPAARR